MLILVLGIFFAVSANVWAMDYPHASNKADEDRARKFATEAKQMDDQEYKRRLADLERKLDEFEKNREFENSKR